VACPCALGLATPLAVSLALGEAAKRGILIRSGEALQHLAQRGIILLDKTGTLTTGELEVREINLPQANWEAVVALESKSSHPIAKALVTRFSSAVKAIGDVSRFSHVECEEVEYKPGGGIRGVIVNHIWAIGHVNYLASCGVKVPEFWLQQVERYSSQGLSLILVARDSQVVGALGLADHLRPEAEQAISDLTKDGWRVGILSGDNAQVVSMLGERLGVERDLIWGGKSPEEKLAIVRDLRGRTESVVMVGDGVNDAAALAQADVGIAVKGGAEISLQAATIYLKNSDLGALRDLSRAGRNTIRAIQRNFVASISYNIFAVGLAVAGLIHPLIAAGLMPISSITVIGVTLATRIYPKAEHRTSGNRREQ
jgi:Cu2+-exporting ATPase